jgi:hypothetical protein
MFVPAFVMVTVALGTTAPVGSVTVPVMTPCTVCDQTAAPLARISRATAKITKLRSLILSPLSKALLGKSLRDKFRFKFLQITPNQYATQKHQKPGQTPLLCAIQLLPGRKVKSKLEFGARRNLHEPGIGST